MNAPTNVISQEVAAAVLPNLGRRLGHSQTRGRVGQYSESTTIKGMERMLKDGDETRGGKAVFHLLRSGVAGRLRSGLPALAYMREMGKHRTNLDLRIHIHDYSNTATCSKHTQMSL